MLLSLPFLWGGQLTGMFQMPISIPLLKTAWRISADGEIGFTALTAIARRQDSGQALACALEWMETHPRTETAAYAGILAAGEGLGDIARDMHARCLSMSKDKLGVVELLEFVIAQRFEPFGASIDCARRLENRTDLSPTVSGLVQTELLWLAMFVGRFDDADRRGQRMLAVGEAPVASAVLAAISGRNGNEPAVARHMSDAAKLQPAELHYYSFLAFAAAGSDARAQQHLNKLREHNSAMADHAVVYVNLPWESK